MPLGIVIPTSEDTPMYLHEFHNITDYQEVIGGYIEPVELFSPVGATMYLDEEGLLKRPPLNPRATLAAMVHNPAYLFNSQNFLGPAIIVGNPDDEGETQDVPDFYVELMTRATKFKVGYQRQYEESWTEPKRLHNTLSEAYEFAISSAYVRAEIEAIRVVPA